jgi:hypothetical protein
MDDSLVCQELRKKVLAVRAGGPIPHISEYYTRKIRDKGKRITRRGRKHEPAPVLTRADMPKKKKKGKDWAKELEGYQVEYRDYSATPYKDFNKFENAKRVAAEKAAKEQAELEAAAK